MFKLINEKLINKIMNAIDEHRDVVEESLLYIEMDLENFYIYMDSETRYVFSKKLIGKMLGNDSVKRIILVRKDILSDIFISEEGKMGAGKLAAQVGHAIEALNFKMLRNNVDYKDFTIPKEDYTLAYNVKKDTAFSDYSEGSFTKIILTVKNETQFLNFYNKLKENNINAVLIQDSGFTVFNNVPTYTTIGIEPEYAYIIDCFTSKFQLLK